MKSYAMKTAVATAMLMALGAGAALAQGPPDPAAMAERQLTRMTERLKLTADQEKKLKPILLESSKANAKMREKMTPGEPPSEEMRAEMMKSRQALNAKVAEVLTDDQKKDYEKMQSEMRGGQGGGRKKQQN
jgi:hypothetical protein